MTMINTQPQLGIFSLVGLIMLVLAASSYVYLSKIEKQTPASRLMARFFLCVSLSALATIVTNLDQPWSWAFAPSQDAFLILGGVFLARFSFAYPEQAPSDKQRWIVGIFLFLAILALSYSAFFAFQYLRDIPADLDEIQAYYLLTPISVLGMVWVMLSRSVSLSRSALKGDEVGSAPKPSVISALLKPALPAASGFRNLGLALLITLIPLVVFLVKALMSGALASFLFNFGIVMAISAIMLVYLNMVAEYTSLMIKLVGISLVTVLLLLGGICTTILTYFPSGQSAITVEIFIAAVILSSGFLLFIFPALFQAILIEPLDRLQEGVRDANQGNLDVVVDVKYTDEIGFLTGSFNQMLSTIKGLSSQLQEKADRLEEANIQKTDELIQINQQLLKEVQQRALIQEQLNQSFVFEHALAECSRALLQNAESWEYRRTLLNQVVGYLLAGMRVSRAYIFEFYEDETEQEKLRMIAEACAPGIPEQITNDVNQYFPVDDFPEGIVKELAAGQPVFGTTERLFQGHSLLNALLSQKPPLLSVALFPITLEDVLWGFVGFDDCLQPREWSESAIHFLGLASEIIGSSIHRWEISDQLFETLEMLEQRIENRTENLNKTNQLLLGEITRRKNLQGNLENRLQTEFILSRASASLADAREFHGSIETVLKDLGIIMNSASVSLVINRPERSSAKPDIYQWCRTDNCAIDGNLGEMFLDPQGWLLGAISSAEPIWIDGLQQIPDVAEPLKGSLEAAGIGSFIIWPLIAGDMILGLLLICNSRLELSKRENSLNSIRLFTKMLAGVLERDLIVQTLEQRVTDQTREISTLYEITLQTAGAGDLSEMLFPALVRVQEISRSEAACIYILDKNDDSLELVSHLGLSPEVISEIERIPLSEESRDWLECPDPDYGQLSTYDNDMPRVLHLPGYGSYLVSRLRALGSTLGILVCYRKQDNPFSPFHISVLAIVGELLGVVIRNYQLALETRNIAAIQERQRLARDLHDAVSQSLYSLSLFARSARDAQQAGEQDKLADSLQLLEENSLSALREMRLLLYQLRSIALEEADLSEAVETRLEMVERRLGIKADFKMDEEIDLSPELEHDLFQIITEALNNSLRYAGANEVSVVFSREGEGLELTIQDNGIGFAIDQVQKGMGLDNIDERLQAYHGRFIIDSGPGKGTTLNISLVFPPEL